VMIAEEVAKRLKKAGYKRSTRLFTDHDIRLAIAISHQAALTIQRARLLQKAQQLEELASTDPLTGLFNRRYLEETLERDLARLTRKQQPAGFVMLDIDHFKRFNDTYGHDAGDAVLRTVARTLRHVVDGAGVVARYGGEEFVIILPEASAAGAIQVAQRLRRGVAQSKFFAGSPLAVEHISISVGIAMYPTDTQYKSELIEHADAALYAAKSAGRNRVVAYSDLEKKREVS